MYIHKEGYKILLIAFLISMALVGLVNYLAAPAWVCYLTYAAIAVVMVLFLQFFRRPVRNFPVSHDLLYSPADGKVVAIENVFEPEVLQTQCKQISVFMSPINVHFNMVPVNGECQYVKYHPGKYLVAWHPKSSTENERTTFMFETEKDKTKIVVRQIAGAAARRIRWYLSSGQKVKQGTEMGFIKFGSRVDIFVPTDAEILVALGQKTTAGITPICKV